MLAALARTAGRATLAATLRARCPLQAAAVPARCAHTVDRSKVPVLREEDIEEKFVHGSGPGGQAVNKLSNCVVIRHTPTGLVVRCHESRLLHENRKLAREMLLAKLDDLVNGSASVASQKLRIKRDKQRKLDRKKEKLRELKRRFIQSQGRDSADEPP